MNNTRFKKPKTKHVKFPPLEPGGEDLRPDYYLHSHARKIRRARLNSAE